MTCATPEIDAVVTWVDGSKPSFSESLSVARKEAAKWWSSYVPASYGSARYRDNNEIEYCIRGIRKHLPWIRNIHLVTAQQIPKFLEADGTCEQLGVRMTDHQDIFQGYEWALPTFNSISIGTMLHRIPGLADRYIYFNDDVIPIRPADAEDFFVEDKVVLRGDWDSTMHYGPAWLATFVLKALASVSRKDRSAHLLAQMRAAKLAGFRSRYFHSAHAPHAVYTPTLKRFFSHNQSLLAENIKYRFRNLAQFVAHPLAHHLQVASGNFIIQSKADHLTLSFSKTEAKHKLPLLDSTDIKFLCLQSLELADDGVRRAIMQSLQREIPGCGLHPA